MVWKSAEGRKQKAEGQRFYLSDSAFSLDSGMIQSKRLGWIVAFCLCLLLLDLPDPPECVKIPDALLAQRSIGSRIRSGPEGSSLKGCPVGAVAHRQCFFCVPAARRGLRAKGRGQKTIQTNIFDKGAAHCLVHNRRPHIGLFVRCTFICVGLCLFKALTPETLESTLLSALGSRLSALGSRLSALGSRLSALGSRPFAVYASVHFTLGFFTQAVT